MFLLKYYHSRLCHLLQQ